VCVKLTSISEEYVGSFHIAMNNVLLMHVTEALHRLSDHVCNLGEVLSQQPNKIIVRHADLRLCKRSLQYTVDVGTTARQRFAICDSKQAVVKPATTAELHCDILHRNVKARANNKLVHTSSSSFS
jgi:hypothetical protein